MLDQFGNELTIGDTVVYANNTKHGALILGEIIKFTNQGVQIKQTNPVWGFKALENSTFRLSNNVVRHT